MRIQAAQEKLNRTDTYCGIYAPILAPLTVGDSPGVGDVTPLKPYYETRPVSDIQSLSIGQPECWNL